MTKLITALRRGLEKNKSVSTARTQHLLLCPMLCSSLTEHNVQASDINEETFDQVTRG